jgi:hypothetical protein
MSLYTSLYRKRRKNVLGKKKKVISSKFSVSYFLYFKVLELDVLAPSTS